MNKSSKIISSLIKKEPDYSNIKARLSFDKSHTGIADKSNNKNALRIVIPLCALGVVGIIMIIAIPIIISHSGSQKLVFNTSLKETLEACYDNRSLSGENSLSFSKTTVGNLYNIYKNDETRMNVVRNTSETLLLHKEDKHHCVYTTKEVHDLINERADMDIDDYPFSIHRTEIFIDLCKTNQLDYETEVKKLKEVVIDDKTNSVSKQIGDLYLLDVIDYYKTSLYQDNYFVRFLSNLDLSSVGSIDFADVEKNINYRICHLSSSKRITEIIIDKYEYFCMHILDFFSLKIEKENDLELVKSSYYYEYDRDSEYYKEIDECVISKSYSKSWLSYDEYNAIYDYKKLVRLFNLS